MSRAALDVERTPGCGVRPPQPDVVGHACPDGDRGHRLRAHHHGVPVPSQPGRRLALERIAARPAVGHAEHRRAVVSFVPSAPARKAGEGEQLQRVRLWLVASVLFALVFLALRVMSSLLSTSAGTAMPTAPWCGCCSAFTPPTSSPTHRHHHPPGLFYTGPLDGQRYVDVSENSFYWYFVVASWLPIYAVIYWVPRLT